MEKFNNFFLLSFLSKKKTKNQKLIQGKKKSNGGRNNQGKICFRYQGGFHKNRYRILNKKFFAIAPLSFIKTIEYDPNRNAKIAKIQNLLTGENFYILNNTNSFKGSFISILHSDIFENYNKTFIKFLVLLLSKDLLICDNFASLNLNTFSSFFLSESAKEETSLPYKLKKNLIFLNFKFLKSNSAQALNTFAKGSFVSNLELYPNKGGQLARAGNAVSEVIYHSKKYTIIKCPSGQFKAVLSQCFAQHSAITLQPKFLNLKKSIKTRILKKRPHVRGVAMNPVDHPHGGGEGKTSGGRPSVSPWGIPTKGFKTNRKKKNYKHQLVTKILAEENL